MIKSGTFRKYRSISCSRGKLLETVIVWSLVSLCAWVLYMENRHLSTQRNPYDNYTNFSKEEKHQNFSNITEEISYDSAEEDTDVEEDEDEQDPVGNVTYWQSSRERKGLISKAGRARRLPSALIIGVKKAGTESLVNFLGIHPKIKRAKKEIHFFDRRKMYRRGYGWYRRQMPYSNPDQITIEKSPNYFDKDSASLRIHEFNSSIKLILIVRDPTQRLISDYTHNSYHPGQNNRLEHWLSFEAMAFHENGTVKKSYYPVYRGVYHIHYSRYLKYFSKDQILVVDGDLFMKDPYVGCKQVEQFLGLPPFIERDHFVFSHRKHFFCKRIKGKTICLPGNKGRKHTVIANQTLDKMRRFYRPHNEIFEKMLNYKFSWP